VIASYGAPGVTAGRWTPATGFVVAAANGTVPNAIRVDEHAVVPSTFAKVLGVDQFDIHASAVACQPCGTAEHDIMVVLDRTGSMCDNPDKATAGCYDLNNAKDGIRTLLRAMDPAQDRIGLVAFPPLPDQSSNPCDAPASPPYDSPVRKYLADGLGSDWKLGNGSLNPASGLVVHTTDGGESSCVQNGGTTSYSLALDAASRELQANGRSEAQRIIVFMTDGEANIGPVWTCSALPAAEQAGCTDMPADGIENTKPCQAAINTATTIKSENVLLYTIGYALQDSGAYCASGQGTAADHWRGDQSVASEREQPLITPQETLTSVASPGNAYATAGDLDRTFAAIAADISGGTSRLVG
jgi:hypothetical protein